jgi:hypothetical protein
VKLAPVAAALALALAPSLAAAKPTAAKPAPVAAADKTAALAVVDAWVKAQNDGDFAAYGALYDASFVGVKRTNDGGQKTFTLDKWKADRKKMFKAKQKVVAENASVAAAGGRVTVGFVQRYQAGAYADHGDKSLVLAPGKDGALRIVREEMLYSAPGWTADPKAELDASALVSPITVRVVQEASDPDAIDKCGDDTCCGEVEYTLVLTDAKGKTLKADFGAGLVPVEHKIEEIAPDKGDTLFEIGEACGEVEADYRIVRDGDALVVRSNFLGEEAKQDKPWTTELTIKVPAGATIK